MTGFKTKSSVYYLDTQNKRISGGIFKEKWYGYTSANIIIGTPAVINLTNGQVIKTSIVEGYI